MIGRGRGRATAAVVSCLALAAGAAEPAAARRVSLSVRETAGIRRFGYPVHAVVPLGRPAAKGDRFRLLENGKPVAAQFAPAGDRPAVLHVDFTASHAPLEERVYTLEYGPEVPAGPNPGPGLKVEAGGGALTVSYPGGLQFVVPQTGLGLLQAVRTKEDRYLHSGSPGLWVRTRDGRRSWANGLVRGGQATVLRQGPFAVALRLEGVEVLPGVGSTLDLVFPRSKSWVEATWTVPDPKGEITGLGAELLLDVAGDLTLTDFGAGSFVYAPLRPAQAARLRAGAATSGDTDRPLWETFVGPANALQRYVVAPQERPTPAEGWAHVMDRTRCTAVAVEGFGTDGRQSEILVTADGRLRLGHALAPGAAGPKSIHFWLHFVPMPVHVGAATSPQSMLAPLRVKVAQTPHGTP